MRREDRAVFLHISMLSGESFPNLLRQKMGSKFQFKYSRAKGEKKLYNQGSKFDALSAKMTKFGL